MLPNSVRQVAPPVCVTPVRSCRKRAYAEAVSEQKRGSLLKLLQLHQRFDAMKINENTLLEGHRVVLVPYNVNHVPR